MKKMERRSVKPLSTFIDTRSALTVDGTHTREGVCSAVPTATDITKESALHFAGNVPVLVITGPIATCLFRSEIPHDDADDGKMLPQILTLAKSKSRSQL